MGGRGEGVGLWSLFMGSVHGHLDVFLGEILDPLASLPFLFVFAVFILFLFVFFYFVGFVLWIWNEEERENGSFEISFFFFLDSRDGSLSRDWKRKRIFGLVGIHGKTEYG